MKRISIYNSYVKDNRQKREHIANELRRNGFHTTRNGELLVIIGGDGTFLSAVKKKIDQEPVFVGLNAGNLGFFSEFDVDDIDAFIQVLKKRQYKIEEIPMYEVHLHGKDGVEIEYFVNEVVVSYKPSEKDVHNVIHLALEVDGQTLFKSPADNFIVSSMVGSTGHSLNAGGPLSFSPDMLNIVATNPVMNRAYPHRVYPAIVPNDREITIYPSTNKQRPFKIICDSQGIKGNHCRYITIKKSEKTIKVLRTEKYSQFNHIYHNLLNFE